MITGYRIADPAFSHSPQEMLSGYGANLYGGRWNTPGHAMVYLGDSIAQASLELLVHVEDAGLLDAYVLLQVQIPTRCVLRVPVQDLPEGWDDQAAMNSPAQQVGDRWLHSNASLALEVPSTAVPGGINLLLNPGHQDVDQLVVGDIETYQFDERRKDLFSGR